jgi:hypothetical protein
VPAGSGATKDGRRRVYGSGTQGQAVVAWTQVVVQQQVVVVVAAARLTMPCSAGAEVLRCDLNILELALKCYTCCLCGRTNP